MDSLKAVMIALFVSSLMTASINWMTLHTNRKTNDVRYGQQAGAMVGAVRTFANVQRSTIITAVTAAGGNAAQYGVANLIAAGILDPSVTANTPTGGTWCIEFRTYNAGVNLQGVLTVVGETAPNSPSDAAVVAQNAATPYTGVVSGGNAVYPSGSQALSAYTGAAACAPGANAFAAVITDADSIGTTNYWARVAIPNNPSANVAAVNESLGGNSLLAILNETGTGASQFATYSASTSISSPAFLLTSDEKVKHDIHRITDPWRLLAPIHGYRFRFDADDRLSDGVLAQQVEKTMPELVRVNPDSGTKEVNYLGLFGAVIEELRHLRNQQMADRHEITRLSDENSRLRSEQPSTLPGGRPCPATAPE